MLNYSAVSFRYEPYPIGVAKDIFEPSLYAELCATFPGAELFREDPVIGRRSSFSPANNAAAYRRFVRANPAWREVNDRVRSRDFIARTLRMLSDHGIELLEPVKPGIRGWVRNFARGVKHGSFVGAQKRVYTELVFCRLPADGGFLFPHTDYPGKIANMALSMNGPGEWDPAFGGSTDIDWPNDPARSFNRNNRRGTFDEVHLVDRIPYAPNQAVIVIKTYNSWHSVRPMQGHGSNVIRKTININLLQ